MTTADETPCIVRALMTGEDVSDVAAYHTLGSDPVPQVVVDMADGRRPHLVWRNELGGLTFRVDDRFLKWNPRGNGIDLERERVRLQWLSDRHPAPRVIALGIQSRGAVAAHGSAPWRVRRGGHLASSPSRSDPGDRHGPARPPRDSDR